MINQKIKQLIVFFIGIILLFSQAGFTSLQTVYAATLENAVTIYAVDDEGNIVLKPQAVKISSETTAFEVLEQTADELDTEPFSWGLMINGINGVQTDGSNFWGFYINGSMAMQGADTTTLSHGDNIQFILTPLESEESDVNVTVLAIDGNGDSIIDDNVSVPKYSTAYDAFRVAADKKVKISTTIYSDYLTMVTDIDGILAAGECGYWATFMNDDYMSEGLVQTIIQDGDVLKLSLDQSYCEGQSGDDDPQDEGNENDDDSSTSEDEEDGTEPQDEDENEVEYTEALNAVVDYLTKNLTTMDWYGYSAIRSFGENIQSQAVDHELKSLSEDGFIENAQAIDLARIILILTAAGYDVTDIHGTNLVKELLNKRMQTNNFYIYSLLAIDSANYEIPQGTEWTRVSLVEKILELELDNGGWSFFGDTPSTDITGMALLALSPYKDQPDVKKAINRAIEAMSHLQDENGGFYEEFNGGFTSEAASMLIVGLSSVGVDATSQAFTKADRNLLEFLLSFQLEDGSFKHVIDDNKSSEFATNQAALALVAYDKFKNNDGTVFKFAKGTKQPPQPTLENTVDKIADDNQHAEVKETNEAVVITVKKGNKNETTIKLTHEVINNLIKENKKVVIDQDDAQIIIPNAVLKQLNENGETVEIKLVNKEVEGALGAVYDFEIIVGGEVVSNFESPITLKLAVDPDKVKNLDRDSVKAFYYNETTKEWEVIENSEYDPENGIVTFETDHFSIFGVFVYENSNENEVDSTPEIKDDSKADGKPLPKTATNSFNMILFGFIIAAAGVTLYIVQRRKVNG